MAIDEQKLLAAIDYGRQNAYGVDDTSTLGIRRASAIEAYLGLNTNPAPEGRSQIVDRTVFESIQTMLPSLVRIFAGSSDNVCKFEAIGPGDEEGAEQTTQVVSWYVTQKNNWEQICSDWIHDAMLLCNSYCMAYWDESDRVIRERYDGQSDDQLTMLMQDSALTILEHSSYVDKQATQEAQEAWNQQMQQWQQAAPVLQAQGQPIPPQPQQPGPVTLHDLVVELRENEGKVCLQVLPPEHCFVDANTPNWTLKECRYFEYVQEKTRGDLEAMGLQLPDHIGSDEDIDDSNIVDLSRDRFGETGAFDDDSGSGALRKYDVRSIWVEAEAEGDKKARMYYVIAIGKTILHAEPCGRIPVSSMTPQPLPHRHIGMSVAEQILDIQQVKTAIKRGGLDNLWLANNGRYLISSRVSLEDFLDSRPGGAVRMLDDSLPGEGHIVPLVHPFAFDSIVGSLDYFDRSGQGVSGAAKSAGRQTPLVNQTATATAMEGDTNAMRVEHIARMMAPAVEELFSIVWEVISKHANKALTIKLSGEWTLVDPQAWRTKRDCRITVGVGAGNKIAMQAQLGATLQAQMQTLPLGLAGPEQIHATVTEMTKLAGFANPDRFWVEAGNIKPMPMPPPPEVTNGQTAIQLKQMELQADAQKFQAETALKRETIMMESQAKQEEQRNALAVQAANDARDAEREQMRAQMDAQVKAIEANYRREMDILKAELEKYKADLDSQTKLAIAGLAPATSPEVLDASMQTLDALRQSVEGMFVHVTTPPRIMRDPATGKAVAIQKGQMTRNVIRDQTGRVAGLQ